MLIQIHANLLKNHFLSNIVHTKYEIIHLQYKRFTTFTVLITTLKLIHSRMIILPR